MHLLSENKKQKKTQSNVTLLSIETR